MTTISYRRSIAVVAYAAMPLLCACGSTPTAAPVIERSPNAGSGIKKTPAATGNPVAASKPQAAPATAPIPEAKDPAVTVAPAPAPVKLDKPPAPLPEKSSAPAEEPTTKPYREGDWRPEYHTIKKGDTLYSIALDYGQDYRELASWNNLEDPGLIKIDQRLRLFPPDSVGEAAVPQPTPLAAPVVAPTFTEPRARKLPYSEQVFAQLKGQTPKPAAGAAPAVAATGAQAVKSVTPGASDGRMTWEWPAQGALLYEFGQGANQKGVGIAGRSGQPVLAAAPGKVVYSGSGLRGYGKLIIIKHNASYLSVYAHNNQLLVKEGQVVAKGQKIAEIGDTDSDRIALHFEIRRLGKPIDPLQYLPERSS